MAKVAPKSFEDLTRGTPFEGKSEEAVKNSLYGKALQQLRNEHADEFVGIVEDLFAAYGLTYRRRLTDEQKAEQQIATLLAAHPNLASKFPAAEPVITLTGGPKEEVGTI